jgi:zinc protease
MAMAKATKVRMVEGITEYHLDNGLQVLLFPDDSQSTVTVNITYMVGSRLEGYGETGMAHLLEHMMFKGSPRHRNVLKLVEEKGGQLNGSTVFDRTNYYETLPASQANLDWALDLEADRMVNAEVSADDLKTEFSVVRNEFEKRENSPPNVLHERVWSTAYLWHNYGKSTIGSRVDIEKVPAPTLRKFYEKYYQPDNATVIVSGKFDDKAALASIEKTFGMVAKPTRVLVGGYTIEPVQDGEREVELRRKGDVSVVETAYHVVSGTSPDAPVVDAANDILTRDPSGRLYKKLVVSKLAASVSGGTQGLHDPGMAEFVVQVRDPKNVDKVTQILESEVESFGASKIDPADVERWRVSTLKEIELQMTDSQQMAVFLSEFIAQGDWRVLFAYRDAVKKVTADDVARVAKAYFKPSNRTLGKFVPIQGEIDRAPLTEPGNIAEFVKGVKEGTTKEQGEQFAATLDNIEARTARKELKGGIKAAFLPKKTRGGKVHLALHFHWGDEKGLQNKGRAGSMMGSLMERGTTTKSNQQVKDLEDKLKAHISLGSDATGLQIDIETTKENLAPALDLAGEMATAPAFSDKELDLVRQEQLAAFEQQLQNPTAIAFNTLQNSISKWPKADPRYPDSVADHVDDLKKVTAAEVKQFYKDFAGAGHGELSVVGDFDPAAVGTQVEKLFAGWQTKKPYKRLDNKAWGVAGSEKSINIKDKEQTTLALMFDVPMKDTDADYAAWLMASEVLGGYSGSRLWMRIREKEGLTYGVQSFAFAGSLDDAGGFGAFLIVAPQNLAKAKVSMLEEFNRMASGEVATDELGKAKDTWLKEQDTSLSDDNTQTEMLVNQLYRNRTVQFTKDLRAKVAAVTPADIQRVAKKYYDQKRLTIVDAGDQSKAK